MLARTSVIIAIVSVASSACAFANQLLLARYFGAGSDLDAMLVAVSLPLTITGILVGAMNYQLVPNLSLRGYPSAGSRAFAGSVAWLLGSMALGVALSGIVGSQIVSENGKFLPEQKEVFLWTARISWASLPAAVLCTFYTARSQMHGSFIRPAYLAPIPVLCAATSGIIFHAKLGILSFPVGQFAGTVFQVVVLASPFRDTLEELTAAKKRRMEASGMMLQLPLACLALLAFSVYPAVDAFWAPKVGPSTMSYLGYSQRVIVGIGAIMVASASTVIFPRLSIQAANSETKLFTESLDRTLRALVLILTPICIIVSVWAVPLVALAFERGAFTRADSVILARILPGMLLGLVPMCCVGIQYKAMFAKHDLLGASLLSVLGTAAYFTLAGFCSHAFGVIGFSAAYASTWWLLFFGGDLRVHGVQHWPRRLRASAPYLAQIAAICIVSAAAATAIGSGLRVSVNLPAQVLLTKLGLTSVGVFLCIFVVGHLVRLQEIVILSGLLPRLLNVK